jgi:hypothetical protein
MKPGAKQSQPTLIFINTTQHLSHEEILAQDAVIATLASRKEKLARASKPKVKVLH